MADASDLVQDGEEPQTQGEALFNDVFGADEEEKEAKKRLAEKQKEKEAKGKPKEDAAIEEETVSEKPHSDEFTELKSELGQKKIVQNEELLPVKKEKKARKKKAAEEETIGKKEAQIDARKHREAIKKLVLSKAKKAAEEHEEQEDNESEVHDFLENNVVEEVSEEDLLKEQGTREEGIRAAAKEKRESEVERKEKERELALEASAKIKPELSFLSDKEGNVYIGRKQSVLQKYGNEAALFLGRVFEEECKDKNVHLDGLNPHVVFVCGARGSGKSYLLGIIAEELAIKNPNVGVVVVDPVGVFWSMRFPNKDEKELESLSKWGLKPRGLDNVCVFIPEGMKEKVPGNTFDKTLSLPPALLTADDWCLTYSIDRFSPSGLLLEKALFKIKKGYRNKEGKVFKGRPDNFSLDELIRCLETDEEINSPDKGYKSDSIRALSSRFDAAKAWGIFGERGTPLGEISKENQLTIIDTSFLEDNVSALVIGLLARRLLAARKLNTRTEASQKFKESNAEQFLEQEIPPTWLFVDEAHTLIPSGNMKTPASSALIEYVKQGRQPGCSLVFATQQPSAIDTKVLSQLDIIVVHKLVFDDDVKAVFKRTPTIIPKQYKASSFIKTLPVGIAMTGDRREETSRAFVMKVRPRMSQHEGREAVTTERQKAPVTKDQARRLAVSMIMEKLEDKGKIGIEEIAKTVQTVNSRYKQAVAAEEILKDLQKQGAALDEKKTSLLLPQVLDELAEEQAFEKKRETSVEAANEATVQEKKQEQKKEIVPAEELELVALPVRISEEKARSIAESKMQKRFFGLLGKSERLKRIELKFEPVYRVKYDVSTGKGEFIARECFINSISGEFLHFEGRKFVESKGVCLLWDSPQEEINLLKQIIGKNIVADAKQKSSALEALVEKGLVQKTAKENKIIYSVAKEIEGNLPTSPTHQLLQSVANVPFIKSDVVSIEQPVFEKNAAAKLLQKLFAGTIVKRIEDIYRPVYEAAIEGGEKSRMVKIDAMTGAII